jgi:hypothetical protein
MLDDPVSRYSIIVHVLLKKVQDALRDLITFFKAFAYVVNIFTTAKRLSNMNKSLLI